MYAILPGFGVSTSGFRAFVRAIAYKFLISDKSVRIALKQAL
jgi:hypothetical protein